MLSAVRLCDSVHRVDRTAPAVGLLRAAPSCGTREIVVSSGLNAAGEAVAVNAMIVLAQVTVAAGLFVLASARIETCGRSSALWPSRTVADQTSGLRVGKSAGPKEDRSDSRTSRYAARDLGSSWRHRARGYSESEPAGSWRPTKRPAVFGIRTALMLRIANKSAN
jgi:hypothetical protein